MAIFKQKTTLYEFMFAVFLEILNHPEFFPSDESLLEQGEFTAAELKRIQVESPKLAIAYVSFYIVELRNKRKFNLDDEHIDSAFDQAIIQVIDISNIDLKSLGTDELGYIDNIETYINKGTKHADGEQNDAYYSSFKYFQQVIFKGKKNTEIPIATVTLGKFIREHVSKRLVDELFKDYKVVG